MTLPLQALRPVGNPIKLQNEHFNSTFFCQFQIGFYNSGTAALAAAIGASIKRKPGIASPEVILPAYGCPDLISAIVYAGARPVLVDLEPDSPWMSLQHIENVISTDTTAILAVRFLGIAERMDALQSICSHHQLTLIEDSAQGFPLQSPETFWRGDFNILSFGRGKPINLLCGGAVLSKSAQLHSLLAVPASPDNTLASRIKYRVKTRVYNAMINPIAYGLVSKTPGLNIGETRYKPLSDINGMPDFAKEYLNANIKSYLQSENTAISLRNCVNELNNLELLDLASMCNHDFSNPLLRYPLLVSNGNARDVLYNALAGLGASKMYQQPIAKINNIPKTSLNVTGEYANAQKFADRLITLPTHQGVTQKHIIRIEAILKKYSN